MHQGTFLECLYSASLVPLCFGGQKKVRHINWSWASDGFPSWQPALPSAVGSSVTWPRCWWCLLAPGLWCCWYSRSNVYLGQCGDNIDGIARGGLSGSGRWPKIQSHIGGWSVRRLCTHWSSLWFLGVCCSTHACTTCQMHCLPLQFKSVVDLPVYPRIRWDGAA